MKRNRTSFGSLSRALRFCLTLIVLTALNIPHIGMAAVKHEPATAMVHTGQSHETMTGAGNIHDKMGGPLCATLCLGTDKVENPALPQRVLRIRFVQWFGEIEPAWPSFAPDAALRPPDLRRNA